MKKTLNALAHRLSIMGLFIGLLFCSNSFADDPTTTLPMEKQQEWLNDIIQNMDISLFFRIQKNAMDNMSLISLYSQEYYQCLKAEGAIDESDKLQQKLSLEQLIEHVKVQGGSCHHIVKTLIGKMNLDFSEEEFEQGLSPRYLEKYRDLKSSI